MSGRAENDPAIALREHLIDTAQQLLATTPISAITTREIARAAAVSDGVLYNYFGDKNDLLVAALLRKYRVLADEFTGRVPTAGEGAVDENLCRLAEAMYDLTAQFVPVIAGLVADPMLFHRLFAALHEQPYGPEQLREPLLTYLDGERRLGRIPADADIGSLSLLLMGPTAMLALASHLGRQSIPERSAALRPIVRAMIRGLQPGK